MPGPRQQDTGDGVRVLTLGGAPRNPLDREQRLWLVQALEAAQADAAVRAVVLTGADGEFSAGINMVDYGGDLAAPWIDALCAAVECSAKPVVAAIEGRAVGAGLALALAAHARIAHAEAEIAAPEVRLGLVPSGGVTQRLPRLTGVEVALGLLLSGRSRPVSDPGLARLFDRILPADVLAAAVTLARTLADRGTWARTGAQRVGFRDPAAYLGAVREVAESLEPGAQAEAAIARALEAAILLPLPQGLALEATLFEETRNAPAARAARHLLLAERRAQTPPGVETAQAQPVRSVIIAGEHGAFAEVAIMALDAGWTVHLVPPAQGDGGALRARIAQVYGDAVTRGRLDDGAREERLARLHVDGRAPETAGIVFALGGSAPDLAGAQLRVRVEDVDGGSLGSDDAPFRLRFQPPAHSAPLAELMIAPDADAAQAATLVRALGQARKTMIRAGDAPGMISGNLEWALWTAALALVAKGASPYDVDRAAARLGFAQGPFLRMDSVGLDAAAARLAWLSEARGAPPPGDGGPLRALVAQGRTGRDAGLGFYRHEDGAAQPDDAIADILPAIGGGGLDPEAALEAALVNESARLLRLGVALRASDIDVILVRAFGVARDRGGVLIRADMKGLFTVQEAMKPLMELAPHLWTPDEGLRDLVKNGTGFFGRG
ncbi:enoyl-CoA hydratase-related protein [Roseovarius spongiae]|nr:enoyl-CoA hydratase-related protein [Roseovarius spongiae]